MKLIVTAGRAGSTFLADQLSLHPDVVCINESHYIPILIDAFGSGAAPPSDILRVVDGVRFHDGRIVFESNLGPLGIAPEAWTTFRRELARERRDLTVVAFQAEIEVFLRRHTGASVVIDKTPCYGADLRRFAGLFDDLTVVNLTRDVDASVRSMLKHPGFLAKIRTGTTTWTDVIRHHEVTEDDLSLDLRPGEEAKMRGLWAWRSVEPLRQTADTRIVVHNLRYEDLASDPAGFFDTLLGVFDIRRDPDWMASAVDSVVAPAESQTSGRVGGAVRRCVGSLRSASIVGFGPLVRQELAVARARRQLGYGSGERRLATTSEGARGRVG